jgi:hypothetical protein
MIDPGNGGPPEEAIVVDHPLDEEDASPAVDEDDGSIPCAFYNFRDQRTENNVEVGNVSGSASEISEPNSVTPLRQTSRDTFAGYSWPERPDPEGSELFLVPNEGIQFHDQRDVTNEDETFYLFSPSPTPPDSEDYEEVQEPVMSPRRSQRISGLEGDVEVITQDQPSRRQRIATE